MNRLEELTEWCRNLPEKAAKRILDLEAQLNKKNDGGEDPEQAIPPFIPKTPLDGGVSQPIAEPAYPMCWKCFQTHSPHGLCQPRYVLNDVH